MYAYYAALGGMGVDLDALFASSTPRPTTARCSAKPGST